MAETDIKILGRLVSGTSDKILAGASEIYDDTEGKKQSEINAELKKQVADMPDQWADDLARIETALQEADTQIKGDVTALQDRADGFDTEIAGLKGKDAEMAGKIAALESAVGNDFPVLIGTESLDAITADSVTGEMNIYRFKNDDATTNPPHINRHGFILIQKMEQKLGKYFIGFKQDDSNDYANILFCCEEYLGDGSWGNAAMNIPERIVQETGESTTAVMSQKAVTEALGKAGIPVVEVRGDLSPDVYSPEKIASSVFAVMGTNTGPVIVKFTTDPVDMPTDPYFCYGRVIGGPEDSTTEHSLILDCDLHNLSSDYSTRAYQPVRNLGESDSSTVTRLQLKPLKASYENDLVVHEVTASRTSTLVMDCEYDESSMPQLSIKKLLNTIDDNVNATGAITVIVNDATNGAQFYLPARVQIMGNLGPVSNNKEIYVEGPLGLHSTDYTTGIIDLSYAPAATCYAGFAHVVGLTEIQAYPMAVPITSIDGGNA